jgi:hypothetical protein
MRRVPGCESSWNPFKYFPDKVARTAAIRAWVIARDISAGLYAFKPSTWRKTRYHRRWIWSAKWQALNAASEIRAGHEHAWSCT